MAHTNLKPIRVEIDCVYTCPSCEAETWYTIRELKHKKHLDCLCGKRTRIQVIDSIEVMYAGKATDSLDKTGRASTRFDHNDFIVTLARMGHQKSHAKALVEQCADQYDGDDGKFLSFLLSQG